MDMGGEEEKGGGLTTVDCFLNKASCSALLPSSSVPILPLFEWACAVQPSSWMPAFGGEEWWEMEEVPEFAQCSCGAGSEIIGQREVGAGSVLWTTDTKETRFVYLCRWGCTCVCVCVLMRVYECFWRVGIRAASQLPDSLHMSIPVCLGSLTSNGLKGITGYLTSRYRKDQRNRWNRSDSTWMRLPVLKEQSGSKRKWSWCMLGLVHPVIFSVQPLQCIYFVVLECASVHIHIL